MVQLVDLMPTLAGDPPDDIHGQSLFPLLCGEKGKIRDLAICSPTLR